MHVAEGIVTVRGGMTSHAAVVARGMGKPCVAGAGELGVDTGAKTLTAGDRVVREGDLITIDGAAGEVMLGAVPTIRPEVTGDFATLMGWVDDIRTLGVRANAETPEDARTALEFGAEGIGLSRTEHMFFEPERIVHMRQMILADSKAERRGALDKLLPYQRQDFVDLFEIMDGLPVTIRLLDPPLHEFLPHTADEMAEVAAALGITADQVRLRATRLRETNPMLGHRGCRLGITYPEIYEVQARAIFEAAAAVVANGKKVAPEVMIPLVSVTAEYTILAQLVETVAAEVMKKTATDIPYLVGTMIELPRACLLAGEIAKSAQFFSFGTNDLTQTAFGLSRDDSGSFLDAYCDKGNHSGRPLRQHRQRRRRRTRAHGRRARPRGAPGPQDRHLRRARRRSRVGPLLPGRRPGLRVVFALPGPHRQARGRPGGARRGGRDRRLIPAAAASLARTIGVVRRQAFTKPSADEERLADSGSRAWSYSDL